MEEEIIIYDYKKFYQNFLLTKMTKICKFKGVDRFPYNYFESIRKRKGFLFTINNVIIGFVLFDIVDIDNDDNKHIYISLICVDSDYKNKKFGEAKE